VIKYKQSSRTNLISCSWLHTSRKKAITNKWNNRQETKWKAAIIQSNVI
jgi:hypothetical protein